MEKFIRIQVYDKAAILSFPETLEKEDVLSEREFYINLLATMV